MILALLMSCIEIPEPPEPPIPDLDQPQMVHIQPTGPFLDGDVVTLEVAASDPDGILEVSAYQRVLGGRVFDKVPLSEGVDTWSAEFQVQAPGLEYWFKAIDDSDFVVSSALPEGGEEAPFVLEVVPFAQPAPWSEDFDEATDTFSLYLMGLNEYALETPGFEWSLSQVHAFSGEWAVRHRRGLDNETNHDDWLITPLLDLSGLQTAQVSWQEFGDDTTLSTHSVWVSTGSADPADGAYVLAAEVSAPLEDAWAPGQMVDLSLWAGEERVSIAWRYEGIYADMWVIDDVAVDELGPDIHLLEFAQTPVHPGEVTTLSFDLENRGAPLVDFDLMGSLDGLVFDFELVDQSLDAGERAHFEVPIAIDPAHQDNVLVPYIVSATDGVDAWEWPESLMIGDPSAASVEIELDGEAFLEVAIGSGDPANPTVEIPVVSAILTATAHSWLVDLTPVAQALPPVDGPERWWVRVDGDSAGDLVRFEIATDGAIYDRADLGPFDAEETWFYLPSRPRPAVVDSHTNPEPVAPGDTVSWELTLDNLGGTTVGATTATLSSADPAVSFPDPGPHDLGSDWSELAYVIADISIDPSKIDSRPISVTIEVQDSQEVFYADTVIEVPWPILDVIGTDIVDFDGNGDGLLDVGETATIGVSLTNLGELATGDLVCTLTGPPAVAILQDLSLTPPIAPGAAGPLEFELRLDGGQVGEVLSFQIDCADHQGQWVVATEIFVSQPGWTWFTQLPDASDDAVLDYPFDLVIGRWRVIASTLYVELTSSVDYDPSTLFIEAWMESDYAYWEQYQLVSQSGVGTLRGYTLAAWWSLTPPVISNLDSRRIGIDIDLSSMDLSSNTLSLGFAAGWCGGDTYFCDHYPNDWGDPYQTFLVTDLWFDLAW